MVTHSSILAWRTPWTEEPGGLQSTDCRECQHAGTGLSWHAPFPNTSQVSSFLGSSLLCMCVYVSCSVRSDSLRAHGLQPTSFLCPWNSPGKITGVGFHSLLQGIFPPQESNPGLLHCRQILYHLSHQGSPPPFYNTYQ